MNSCIFTGRLGHDVSIRYYDPNDGSGEQAVGRFSLAIDRNGKGTDWVECVAFGRRAETINKYFHKGSRIAVRCKVKTDYGKEDENGKKTRYTDFIVDEFDFIDDKKQEASKPANWSEADDAVPF